MTPRIHGGPDAWGVPRFDFSTNSNACGPCPIASDAVRGADACHYPDASYCALRQQLAAFHAVDAKRVLLAGSASEFIFRITACVAQRGMNASGLDQAGKASGPVTVCLPPHCYGDYAHAAQAWGLGVTKQPDAAQLVWACEPSSPLGGAHADWPTWPIKGSLVLDRAYEPLRLSGSPGLNDAQLAQVWQLWTPNKALGLTGVRAAYAIAPLGADDMVAAVERLCPSWPVGAHGVAMLQSWVLPEVQAWLAESLLTLKVWKVRQLDLLHNLGWHCLPSEANFFCARPPSGFDLATLRSAGIKLRDAASFGLPGHVRVGVLPPQAQDALMQALQVH